MDDSQEEFKNFTCSCEEWKEWIGHLDSFIILGDSHGIEYKALFFRYCPWCGTKLVEEMCDG